MIDFFPEFRKKEEAKEREKKREFLEYLQHEGVTEEEYFQQKREESKKQQRKENVKHALIFVVVIFIFTSITLLTHNAVMAGILAFVSCLYLMIYLSISDFPSKQFCQKVHAKLGDGYYIIRFIASLAFCYWLGCNIFMWCVYVDGDNDVVYITHYGDCFHENENCSTIAGHDIIITKYGKVKRSKRPCYSCCSVHR